MGGWLRAGQADSFSFFFALALSLCGRPFICFSSYTDRITDDSLLAATGCCDCKETHTQNASVSTQSHARVAGEGDLG